MSKRRTHSPEFKARVAMEAISGRKTIQEIVVDQLIQTSLSSASAANVHCWAYPDRRMTTGFQQTLKRRD